MFNTEMQEYIIRRYDQMCDLPELRSYYNESDFLNFGYWDETTQNQKQACENLVEKLLELIPARKGSILDVACGKGATTAYLLKYYQPHMVTGINISEKQLHIARNNAPGCTFLNMNATDLKFQDNSFDNIICVEAAFHFDTRTKFFEEAHRILKSRGCLVLSDFIMTFEGEKKRKSQTVKNFISNLEEYKDLLYQAGFKNAKLIDATEPCWKRHYWHAVCYFHKIFLSQKIDRAQMEAYLEGTYRRVPDIRYYVLVRACKS
jgi:ubiquinone/menaquinone biosynthesis C-methylase UbiE